MTADQAYTHLLTLNRLKRAWALLPDNYTCTPPFLKGKVAEFIEAHHLLLQVDSTALSKRVDLRTLTLAQGSDKPELPTTEAINQDATYHYPEDFKPPVPHTCRWAYDVHHDAWDTACGYVLSLHEDSSDSTFEYGFTFCPFCAARINPQGLSDEIEALVAARTAQADTLGHEVNATPKPSPLIFGDLFHKCETVGEVRALLTLGKRAAAHAQDFEKAIRMRDALHLCSGHPDNANLHTTPLYLDNPA
jgi:hypothetical protein